MVTQVFMETIYLVCTCCILSHTATNAKIRAGDEKDSIPSANDLDARDAAAKLADFVSKKVDAQEQYQANDDLHIDQKKSGNGSSTVGDSDIDYYANDAVEDETTFADQDLDPNAEKTNPPLNMGTRSRTPTKLARNQLRPRNNGMPNVMQNKSTGTGNQVDIEEIVEEVKKRILFDFLKYNMPIPNHSRKLVNLVPTKSVALDFEDHPTTTSRNFYHKYNQQLIHKSNLNSDSKVKDERQVKTSQRTQPAMRLLISNLKNVTQNKLFLVSTIKSTTDQQLKKTKIIQSNMQQQSKKSQDNPQNQSNSLDYYDASEEYLKELYDTEYWEHVKNNSVKNQGIIVESKTEKLVMVSKKLLTANHATNAALPAKVDKKKQATDIHDNYDVRDTSDKKGAKSNADEHVKPKSNTTVIKKNKITNFIKMHTVADKRKFGKKEVTGKKTNTNKPPANLQNKYSSSYRVV